MAIACDSSIFWRSQFVYGSKSSRLLRYNRVSNIPVKVSQKNYQFSSRIPSNYAYPCSSRPPCVSASPTTSFSDAKTHSKSPSKVNADLGIKQNEATVVNLELIRLLVKCGLVLGAMVCGVLVFECKRVFAAEGVVNAGYSVIGQSILLLRSAWPKLSQLLTVFKEQGLILAALLGLSAFFSMAETSITTLWPWKVWISSSKIRWILHFVSVCLWT